MRAIQPASNNKDVGASKKKMRLTTATSLRMKMARRNMLYGLSNEPRDICDGKDKNKDNTKHHVYYEDEKSAPEQLEGSGNNEESMKGEKRVFQLPSKEPSLICSNINKNKNGDAKGRDVWIC